MEPGKLEAKQRGKACNDPGLVPDSITWSGFSGASSCNGSMSCATTPSGVGCITPIVQIRAHNGTIGYSADSDGSAVAKVVSATVSAADVWNFNGETPAGYDMVSQLEASGGCGGSFSWDLEQEGSGRVAYVTPFSGGENPTVVQGILPSGVEHDIGVIVKYDGVAAGVCATLTVRKPASMEIVRRDPDRCFPVVFGFCGDGYASTYHFKILDNLGTQLPHPVPFHEEITQDFGQEIPDFPGENWVHGMASIDPAANPGDVPDVIGSFDNDVGGRCPAPCERVPHCVNPGQASEGTKVDHYTGGFWCGSVDKGKGVNVRFNTWQRYRGYARHE